MSGGTGTAARRLVRVGRARVAERTRARAVRKSRAVRSGHAANPAAAAVGARQALRVGGSSGPSRRCLRASSVADNESTKGDAGSEVKEEEPGSDSTLGEFTSVKTEIEIKDAVEGGSDVEVEEAAENKESDLWSFIGASEDEDSTADPWASQGLSDADSDEPQVTEEDLPEDLVQELEKCREAKEDLEVIRLKLESEAQDLAELAVEANEKSGEVAETISKYMEQIVEATAEENDAAKDFKTAKKALKKALKKQKKKLKAALDAELQEAAKQDPSSSSEAAEGAPAPAQDPDPTDAGDSIDVQGSEDEDSLDSLQKQVESLEAAYKSDSKAEPEITEGTAEAILDSGDRDWLDGPQGSAGLSLAGNREIDPEASEETSPPQLTQEEERKRREVEEILGLEQSVLETRDVRDLIAKRRSDLEAEAGQLELKSHELAEAALGCDQRADEAMEDVEKAVAAEMAAEAKLEEVENKAEEMIKQIIKEKKEEMRSSAGLKSMTEELEPPSTSAVSLDMDSDNVFFTDDELRDQESQKKEAERKVEELVNEATEILEEATTAAPIEEEDQEEEESEAAKTADEASRPVVAASAIMDAEPVIDTAGEEAQAKEAEAQTSGTLAVQRISKMKQAAMRRDWLDWVDWAPMVRNAVAALTLAASFGIAGRVAYNKGYVTKATRVFQTEVVDRIKHRPWRFKTDEIKQKSSKKAKKSKKVEALEEQEHASETGMTDTLWLLATCVVAVPLISKLPGGSPVLGFLLGGALIGPNALGIINNVNAVKHIAELGVIFLLFNIGLELSFERLQAMQKYVFGLGFSQVCVTMLIATWLGVSVLGLNMGGAVILAAAMSLSSTAVGLQVLQDRGEASSRHGRAAFSVLLFQDLAVVVFLMLTPLLAQSQTSQAIGGQEQVKIFLLQIGQAIVKACVVLAAIIAGGRLMFRPIYKRIAQTKNAEIFAATTLLVVLGTSMLTQKFGLSMELGAFIAGLLLAETEYALQIESDIAPYKGLLLGLFFMTVGMEFSMPVLIQQWRAILATMAVLIAGKTAVVAFAGPIFGLSRIASIRAGLMLAPGGEFAFVLLGEAAAKAILATALCSQMYLVVALGMALTPMLATIGNALDDMYESKDVLKLQPSEGEVDDLRGHVIVAGFGRVGQMICQLLGERLIPFTALDVRSDRVSKGRDMEMPVYFGDSGSKAVLHSVGAAKAACAVVALDTPGANYRCVWAIKKNFPNVKIYVRARDVAHGLNLERAGASAVVPETLEPSLQLAAAVLQEMKLPQDEVSSAIDEYRRSHLEDLKELAFVSGSSLGYGYSEKDKKEDD